MRAALPHAERKGPHLLELVGHPDGDSSVSIPGPGIAGSSMSTGAMRPSSSGKDPVEGQESKKSQSQVISRSAMPAAMDSAGAIVAACGAPTLGLGQNPRPGGPGANEGQIMDVDGAETAETVAVAIPRTPSREERATERISMMDRTRSQDRRSRGPRQALPAGSRSTGPLEEALVATGGPPTLVVRTARGGLGPDRHRDILVEILRGELNAAFSLMEHREAWWRSGIQGAESAVGLEFERLRDSEVTAAQNMQAEMMMLTQTLQDTQRRAESSSMVAVEQQQIARQLDAYTQRLTTQGRLMITNAEHQQRQLVFEAQRAEETAARERAEAVESQMVLTEQFKTMV